jgi:hypothetical protein
VTQATRDLIRRTTISEDGDREERRRIKDEYTGSRIEKQREEAWKASKSNYRKARQVVNPNTKTLPLISQHQGLNQYAAIWIRLSPFSRKPGEDVEVMQNQPVHERNRYSAHFDIRGRVKAIHYDLALKRENDKFLLSDKQLAPVVGTNWNRTWDYVHAPGYYNNDGQVRKRNQQRWKDIQNSDGTYRNKNGVQKLEQHTLRDLVHLTVKDKDVDAE